MPHFSADDHDAEDPDLLRRLRGMLRDPDARRRALPTRAERFGARATADAGDRDRARAREAAPPAGRPARRDAG